MSRDVRQHNMKTGWKRILGVLLAIGVLSPLAAMWIKPANYSFYMFFPATPDTSIERIRLLTADFLLVGGFVLSVASAIGVIVVEDGIRRVLGGTALLAIAAHPLQQPIFLESLDTKMNYRWRDNAVRMNIVGKTPDEILRVFGNPSYVWTETPKMLDAEGTVTWKGETYTGWDYHVLPFYWMGSKFQVFFVAGKVRNFEANDD